MLLQYLKYVPRGEVQSRNIGERFPGERFIGLEVLQHFFAMLAYEQGVHLELSELFRQASNCQTII